MKIIRLESENIKRLKAVRITPEGELVIVGGRNAQGKTSVLDSIEIALGGKRAAPPKPVREGMSWGRIVCDLGDIIVKRNFDASGSSKLVVENKEGDPMKSPQGLLDRMVGALSFDPLEFCNMEPKAQLELLRSLAGVDFTELDRERDKLYTERTILNREVKALAVKRKDMQTYPEAPAEELAAVELSKEFAAAAQAHQDAKDYEKDTNEFGRKIADKDAEIVSLERRAAALKEEVKQDRAAYRNRISALDAMNKKLPDLQTITASIETVEETNRQVRANKHYNDLHKQQREKADESEAMTERIEGIDLEKKRAIAHAGLPVEDLSFDEKEVLLNGIPFSQASSAEQTRVSLAMGVALNPTLRVLLIRNGSLLDDDSLAMVGKFAADNDCQVWIERVGKDSQATVIIEDGEVEKNAAKAQ